MILAMVAAALAGDDDDEPKARHVRWEPGDGIELRDGDGELRIGMWVEPVAAYADFFTIDLRRARLQLRARMGHGLSARLELSGDDARPRVADAYVAWKATSDLELWIGRRRGPSGLELATSPHDLPFLERSRVSQFGAERDLGLGVEAEAGPVLAEAALATGERDPDRIDEHNLDVLARVAVAPMDELCVGVYGGVLLRPDGAPGLVGSGFDSPAWRDRGERLGADAAFVLPRLRVLLEGALLDQGARTPAKHRAVTAVVGVGLGDVKREPASKGGTLRRGGEVLLRAEIADANPPPGPSEPVSMRTLALGLGATVSPAVRLQVEGAYDRVDTGGNVDAGATVAVWMVAGL